MQAEQIAKALGNAKRVGKGWLASCPLPTHGQGNGDRNPSLSISDGEDGKPLFKCHSGCDQHEVFHAIRNYGLLPDIEKREPLANIKPLQTSTSVLEHEWVYVDEDGEPLFVKQRFKTNTAKGKDYRLQRIVKQPNGFTARFPGFKDTRIVPYKFPEMLNAKSAGRAIYLVEGEKAADALISIGAIATSAHAGAASWPEELTQYFAGATVVMVPDNDIPGWQYAQKVAQALIPVVKSLRILDLPVEAMSDDAWDWVNVYGGTRQELAELARVSRQVADASDVTLPERLKFDPKVDLQNADAELAEPGAERKANQTNKVEAEPYKPFKIESWQSVKDEPVSWLIEGVIPERSFVALYGPPASYKSFIAMDIAECIATGRPWLGKEINGTGPVLYIAGEGHGGIGARIAAIRQKYNTPDDAEIYVIRSQINLRSSLDDFTALIVAIDELVERIDKPLRMVVIDTLARAFGGGNENSSDDMGAFIQATGKIQNRYECSLMVLHHAGKDTTKGLRGHSSLLGAVDTQMEIMRFTDSMKGLIFMSKQKDGQDGQRIGFEAVSVDIDRSDLGLEGGTSLVIEARETTENEDQIEVKKQPPDREGKGLLQKYLDQALYQAMVKAPQNLMVGGVMVVATSNENWKSQVGLLAAMDGIEATPKQLTDLIYGGKRRLQKRDLGGFTDKMAWFHGKELLKFKALSVNGGGNEKF